MKSEKLAVVSIGYNRSWTLAKSLRRLALADGVREHDCFLFLDAPYREEDRAACEKMHETAEEIRRTMLPHLQIVRRPRNFGVPGNLIEAINEIFEDYGRVIFFEDDVCISRTFLSYMDRALEYYADNPKVFCINGFQNPTLRIPKNYPFDVYATPRNMAWGFGIWKDRWTSVDFDMKIGRLLNPMLRICGNWRRRGSGFIPCVNRNMRSGCIPGTFNVPFTWLSVGWFR